MRKLTLWLLLIATGWAIGWYSNDHWREDTSSPVNSVNRDPLRAPAEPQGDKTAPARPKPVDELSRLLDRYAFQAAIEHYEVLQDIGDEAPLQRARQLILSTAGSLLAQADYPQAVHLLKLYLVAEFRDVEARMLLAESYQRQKDFRAAIDQLFEAIAYAYRPVMLDQLKRRLRSVIAEQVAVFSQTGDYSGLLELYQHLTQLEPSYAPHFIGLASAQLALNDNDNARRSLLLVAHDPDVGSKAQAMLDQLRHAGQDQQPETAVMETELIGVPLIRRGNHFLVDARINNSKPARLLIDTGASMTILTPAALDRRGIRYGKTGKRYVFNTANGQVSGPVFRLEELSVADWQVNDMEIGVLDLSGSPSIDGLLGMNFLKHFQFFIDQNQALLRLSINSQ